MPLLSSWNWGTGYAPALGASPSYARLDPFAYRCPFTSARVLLAESMYSPAATHPPCAAYVRSVSHCLSGVCPVSTVETRAAIATRFCATNQWC
jgi:hypothetical protein